MNTINDNEKPLRFSMGEGYVPDQRCLYSEEELVKGIETSFAEMNVQCDDVTLGCVPNKDNGMDYDWHVNGDTLVLKLFRDGRPVSQFFFEKFAEGHYVSHPRMLTGTTLVKRVKVLQ